MIIPEARGIAMAEGGTVSNSDRISEIRARLDALRVPTWDADDLLVFGPHPDRSGFLTTIASFLDDESAEFAARARTDIPYLLSEVERLTAERDGLRRTLALATDVTVLVGERTLTAQKIEQQRDAAYAELDAARAQLAASEQRMAALVGWAEALDVWTVNALGIAADRRIPGADMHADGEAILIGLRATLAGSTGEGE